MFDCSKEAIRLKSKLKELLLAMLAVRGTRLRCCDKGFLDKGVRRRSVRLNKDLKDESKLNLVFTSRQPLVIVLLLNSGASPEVKATIPTLIHP